MAVKPNGGTVVHLAQEGYEPGKKHRSIRDHCSLCNVGFSRQERVPLAEALKWPNPDPGSLLLPPRKWTWCRACIGHAVTLAGLSDVVLGRVVEAAGS